MKRRLHRLESLYVKDPVCFVTACTHQRQRLLDNHATHDMFLTFCRMGAESGCYVGRYVLMPDHLHLFVAISPVAAVSDRRGQPLSHWVKALKGKLSAHWRTRSISAPHWQKGFFDHVLRSSESYSEKWRYVLANPVRAGLTQVTEEWPYAGEVHRLEVT